MIDAVKDDEAENLAAAGHRRPGEVRRQAMRAALRRRKPEFAAGVAVRHLEAMLARGLPIRRRFRRRARDRLFDVRRPSRPSQDQSRVADLVAAVAGDQRDLGVLRPGAPPDRCACIWRAPSTICSMPSTCASESWPPDVLVGSAPPMRSAPEATNGAALALLAEAVILELREHHVGEAVVDLRGVDVLRAEARHRVGGLAALLGRRSTTMLSSANQPRGVVVACRSP